MRQAEILKAEGKSSRRSQGRGRTAVRVPAGGGSRTVRRSGSPRHPNGLSAIASGDIQAINYFVAQKYTDALQQIGAANNSKVVLMPLDASSLMGSIAGISELIKEGAGDRKNHDRHDPAHPHLFWLSLGGLLLAAEMLGGSGYLLWSGVAGVVTGALTRSCR